AAPGQQQGKVIETMNSGGYTYALVETAAGNVWVAGPETVVSVGDVVSFPPGTPMEKFRSDTLGREFARIDFVTSLDVVSGGSQAEAPAPTPVATDAVVGNVAETMDGGGYTYVRVTLEDGTEMWAAGPQTKVAVGDRVALENATVMKDFHSPTLDRTFETIDFVGRMTVLTDDTVPPVADGAGEPTVPGAEGHTTAPADSTVNVEPPEGGLSVAELHAQKATLSGKDVTLRG